MIGFFAVIVLIVGVKGVLANDRSAVFYTVALSAWLLPATFQIGAILGL